MKFLIKWLKRTLLAKYMLGSCSIYLLSSLIEKGIWFHWEAQQYFSSLIKWLFL